MKRAARGVLFAVALLLLAPVPSQAGGHGGHGHGGWYGHGGGYGHGGWYGHYSPRVQIGIGTGFWWGPGLGWYGPPPAYYYPSPVYTYPPRVIVAEPPVYIQRQPAALPPSYWYYCASAGGYYPTVPSCPEPWVQVPPRTE